MPDDLSLDSARPQEHERALRLLLSHCPPKQRPARLRAALAMLETGELPADGLLVCRQGGNVVGAAAATIVPGRSGIVWPPRAVDGPEREAIEDRLATHLLEWLRQRGACLAQALLQHDEKPLAGPLLRNGFRHVTGLWYLRHDLVLTPEQLAAPDRLRFESCAGADPLVFRQTMVRTFEGSLDCPEVTDARPIDDVLTGFRAQGVFDPEHWWLARSGEEPVGVLLVCRLADEDTWEVCYTGVVPEGRRKGFGREMLRKALLEARAAGVGGAFLTVDQRNTPAWQMYRSLGFEPFDRRDVYLVVFPTA